MTAAVRASRRRFHVIYKTTCLVTGKWYIGMHSTDDLDDGYMGSGQQLRRSVKKYGKEQHKTEVLEFLPDRESLGLREEELVTKKLMEDELCMNLATGGAGKADRPLVTKESTSIKISAKLKEHYSSERGQATKQRLSETQTGQTRSPETREKMATAKRNISFTDDHRAKLSAAKKGKPLSDLQRANHRSGHKACTIDGVKIYPSKVALAAELGHGKRGARAETFRYCDDR